MLPECWPCTSHAILTRSSSLTFTPCLESPYQEQLVRSINCPTALTYRHLEGDILKYWSRTCWWDNQTHLFRLSLSRRSIWNRWAHFEILQWIWFRFLWFNNTDWIANLTRASLLKNTTHCRCIRIRLLEAPMVSHALQENHHSCHTVQVIRNFSHSYLHKIIFLCNNR